jgi:hypothetical protein
MFEETVNRASRWRVFWPDVSDQSGAREAINVGSWLIFAYAIVSTATVVMAGLATNKVGPLVGSAFLAPIVGTLIALIGLGIRRGLRPVAIIGLAIVGWDIVALLLNRGFPGVMLVFALLGMVNGVRGTFALHRLQSAAPAPTNP